MSSRSYAEFLAAAAALKAQSAQLQQQVSDPQGQQQQRLGRRQLPGARPRKSRIKSLGSSISEPDVGGRGEDEQQQQQGEKVYVFDAKKIMPVQGFLSRK